MAASVLLNFSSGITFSPTDPLMCLIRTGAQLLSYEHISAGRFPDGGNEERTGFIRRKIAEVRNLLEDRCLSSEDQGEEIRLLVLLDFKPWAFLKPEPATAAQDIDTAWPSLKVGYVKSLVGSVFGAKNPLLRRMGFIPVFLDDRSEEQRSFRFRSAAFKGYYTDTGRQDWIAAGDFRLNEARDQALSAMDHPDTAVKIGDQAAYTAFLEKQRILIDRTASYLAIIGLDNAFRDKVSSLFKISDVGQFQSTDYDDTLKQLVTDLCGLGSPRFSDCTCFVTDLIPVPVSQKSKSDLFLKSLLQLLVTIDGEQFRACFQSNGPHDPNKFFVVSEMEDDAILKKQLQTYSKNLAQLESQVSGMVWDESNAVEYTEFHAPETNAEGSHSGTNEAIDEQGSQKERAFRQVRRIPFFFGDGPGDWRWYREVMAALQECLSFEDGNERPFVDSLTRIEDRQLLKESKKTNFGELKDRIAKTTAGEIVSNVDYDKYIHDRKERLRQLEDKAQVLSKVLVKLGIRSRALWIAILSCIVFTLCYAFHFITGYAPDHPLWISAGFLAFCLLCLAGAVIAHIDIKGKIHAAYREIDALLDELHKLAVRHLHSINSLARDMNKADAQRKTLYEMKSKYNSWQQHNNRQANWLSYVQDLGKWLDTLFSDLGISPYQKEPDQLAPLNLTEDILESKPSVVTQIRSRYNDMKPVIQIVNLHRETPVRNVTCFVSRISFKCY